MKSRNYFITALMLLAGLPLSGQTTRQEMFDDIRKTAGVYYAYPVSEIQAQTKAPKGYKPFYISHYGRHGSRYLIADADYKWIIDLFEKGKEQQALTALGEDVLKRLQLLWKEVEGRGSDLTPLGVRQHQGIAERMFLSYPEVFTDNRKISARSTIVLRCAMSMAAFGDKLKELNPKLSISYEASPKYMDYLNFHTDESNRFTSDQIGPWAEEYRKFEKEHTKPERLTHSLFSSAEFIRKQVNPHNLMWGLYWITSGMQDVETQVSFYDLFEKEELFDLWQCINYRFYVGNANHADGKGIVVANAKSLLKNILDSADEAIKDPSIASTLRFGHDGNVIPLAAILRLNDCNVAVSQPEEVYKVWSDYKIVPMAGNIQIIFYKKKDSDKDILVKFLLNEKEARIPVETDTYPYYSWEKVRKYYEQILAE